MVAAGYMAKRVARRPSWLMGGHVHDVYALAACISEAFTDYVDVWMHNGFWLFDSPEALAAAAEAKGASLAGTTLFYYEVLPREFDQNQSAWQPFEPEPSLHTSVAVPAERRLEGFDVVTFSARSSPECSPLSCNNLAAEIGVNEHCLLATLDQAIEAVESGLFVHGEPGPLRIFAVYTLG